MEIPIEISCRKCDAVITQVILRNTADLGTVDRPYDKMMNTCLEK